MTDAHSLTRALGGKWHGRYGVAFCPAHHNTRTPALSLSTGRNGQLLASCHAGCSFAAIIDAMRGLGLVEGRSSFSAPDPMEAARRLAEERLEAEKRAIQAQSLWLEAQPIDGSPAEAYLRGRAIATALPDTLRFHPACWHAATAKRLPAMIAKVEGCERFAVHRTYLAPDGSGKAPVQPDKAMLGAVMGGAVRLSEATERLVVAEGIETSLSLLCGMLEGPAAVWAALSTSGMKGLRLPAQPGQLTIASDGEAAGHEAAEALATRADALGWQVAMLPAPDDMDWNDVLQGKAVDA